MADKKEYYQYEDVDPEGLDYDKDIRIDETALDIEWLEQSALAGKYIDYVKKLKLAVSFAHEKVKTCRSELIMRVNEDPEKCVHKAKPNAADIEAYYRNHSKYKRLKEKWIRLSNELEYAELCQKEISYGRRSALENLVVLHGQNYFAGPRMPRDISAERTKQEEANKKITMKRMTRTK